MTHTKPFHRNVRGIKDGPNSGYSGWAYVEDPEYAKNPEHYVRAFTLILNDLQSIFEYLEPSDECREAYSYRIHALLMRTCIEVEANFKAILEENTFTSPKRLDMTHYRKVDATHHLSSYEVMLPIWNGTSPILKPFELWKPWRGRSMPQGTKVSLPWYQAYNASKHDRQERGHFKVFQVGDIPKGRAPKGARARAREVCQFGKHCPFVASASRAKARSFWEDRVLLTGDPCSCPRRLSVQF